MASLAEIIHRESAEASRQDAVQREIKRQVAAAEVWDGAQELADLELAIKLSKQEASAEGVEVEEDEDLKLAMKLQAEEEALAQEESSAPTNTSQQPQGRAGMMRLTPSVHLEAHGGLQAEDAEGDALDAMIEEEEEEYAALLGIRGAKDLQVPGVAGWTTKHDPRIAGRRNVRRLEAQHPKELGNMSGMSAKLSNRVAGDLSRHFSKRTKKGVARNARVEAAAHQTQEGVLDERTRLILFKLCNTVLGQVHGVVKTGKESAVFTASGWDPEGATALLAQTDGMHAQERQLVGDEDDSVAPSLASGSTGGVQGDFSSKVLPCLPSNASFTPFMVTEAGPAQTTAIKIFRSTLNEFKNRGDYVSGDYRYRKATHGRSLTRQNPRKVVKLWAEKEWANLIRMWRAGLPCPQPLVLRTHVLVMSWLGDEEGFPAPQLKEAKLASPKAWAAAYTQVVRLMCGMYHRCHLVHGDLSEYNLLWHEKRVWVIDTAQAVEVSHPNALALLRRDADNVTRFFAKKNVAVLGVEDLLRFVVSPVTGTDGAVQKVYQRAQQRRHASSSSPAGESAQEQPAASAAGGGAAAQGEAPRPTEAAEYVFGKSGDPVVERLKRAMEGTSLQELGVQLQELQDVQCVLPEVQPPALEQVYTAGKGVATATAEAKAAAIRPSDDNKTSSKAWSSMVAGGTVPEEDSGAPTEPQAPAESGGAAAADE